MEDRYLQEFRRELKNRNYSRNTIKNYSSHLKHFLDFGRSTRFDPGKRISIFLEKEKKTTEQKRLAWYSIKFFYEKVLDKKCPYRLSRVRSRKRIPDVLTNEDAHKLLGCINNKKHFLMICILYGSGLRVSEVCKIRVKDLDFINLKLKIRNSKGNKDRITLLSEKLVPRLENLIRGRIADDFLFETTFGKKYSVRTVQKIFSDALIKSGLKKKASCHTFRHCFATHLVHSGVDIKTVKELLGHKSVNTTLIYIKLADSLSRDVLSPF